MTGYAVYGYRRQSGSMFTYEEADRSLQGRCRERRKVANNTWLERRSYPDNELADQFAIRLHETAIIVIYSDGQYALRTGGWRTVTTKERLNRFSPANVWSDKGVWYISPGVPFFEGMRVDARGVLVDGQEIPPDPRKKKSRLDKMVKEYIQGFTAHAGEHGLSDPGGGDCWGCLFLPEEVTNDIKVIALGGYGKESTIGNTVAQQMRRKESHVMGLSHLLLHMSLEERYYVPSLLWRAILAAGYRDPYLIWQLTKQEPGRWIPQLLRSYFRHFKQDLLEYIE